MNFPPTSKNLQRGTVLDWFFPEEKRHLVIMIRCSEAEAHPGAYLQLEGRYEDARFFLKWNEEGNWLGWNFYFVERNWVSGMFNDVFPEVARGALVHVSSENLELRQIYCPYEGGRDWFCLDEPGRDLARERFREWIGCYFRPE